MSASPSGNGTSPALAPPSSSSAAAPDNSSLTTPGPSDSTVDPSASQQKETESTTVAPSTPPLKSSKDLPRSNASAPRKKSRWGAMFAKLIPCASPSSKGVRALESDNDIPLRGSTSSSSSPAKTDANVIQQDRAAEKPSTSTAPPATPPSTSSKAPILPLTIDPNRPVTPPVATLDEVVPPTPKLLSPSETGGVTSGAVQPPGSTGLEEDTESQRSEDDDDGRSDPTQGEDTVPDEDDEDRLIRQGGIGIPIVDGVPRPLLPPQLPEHRGRKCLVLDLDETLLHSSFKLIPQCDYVVPVEIEWQWHNVYVIKRPGVDAFLKEMGELFEIVVFTASLSKYADPVLDKLDIHKVVTHRLFRESCYNHKGNYVKDLSQLGRPLEDTIILDNSPASYIFHPNNAVPVSSWFNDPHDTELTDLCPFLTDLRTVDDVRGVLDGGL